MYLKNLTLRGFKSFASATTLALQPGITCVVGPNGSGKSNVVDALAWVMGEQGARALRGGQMADVIFAGTSGRAALGRAQVDLTIDNTDGLLDIEYSEVTISRTLFRGGGSEYSINGTPARLLDVQELLSDTGMGRQMHVIVGQGQLDAILSSTPEERRGFIEEAAGVLKHRRRKERALKKLADMDANLVRVLDLTNEIHRQLGPLARQARIARRASLIQARVRDAKARLLADDLASALSKLSVLEESDESAAVRRASLEEQIAAARAELARLEDAERASSPALDQASSDWQSLTTITERLRGTLMAATQKVALRATPELPPGGEDPDVLDERARVAGAEDAALAGQVESARSALTSATRAREAAEDADDAASRELARVNRVIADHREKVARLTGDASTAASRLEAAIAEADRAWGAYRAAQERAEAAEKAVPASSVGSVDPDASDTAGSSSEDEVGGGAARAHAEASARRDAARARVDELLGVEREDRADRARLDGAYTVGPPESLEDAQARADAASRAAREAREAENEARLSLRALEEQSRRAASRARSLRQAAAAEREERARYARREAARRTELATASDVEAAARVALEAAERALAQAAAERDRLSERRSQVSQEVSDARRALDRLSAELSEATASAHQGQIAAEQTRLRVEDLQRRALEELSLEPEQLLAEFGPETLVPMLPLDPDQVEKAAAAEPSAYVRAEQERALAKAQKDLEKLGRVNPLALEEHEALASRHKFLVDQVQDLKQSKADLLRIVQDVDRLVQEAFASAFAETREQFEHVFGVLFPGGVGDLVLTDPDDMLTTGIEIEARPAGKKVKRLSLLSGGERSLAAIAFLVAIFKARPSPFYVMDEVEAALDDMNLTRLLAIFKELQETSQLIVITHQKRTMEIADALYGVTMRDGVTTVVSQRLAD